ncbi:MAG: hypothetical protein AAF761_09270 [Pseudomonadota bacterium]
MGEKSEISDRFSEYPAGAEAIAAEIMNSTLALQNQVMGASA